MTLSTVLDQRGAQQLPRSLPWLARWLHDESDAVLDAMVDQLTGALPELAVAQDDPRVHIRAAVGVHLDALAATAAADGKITMPVDLGRHTRALARQELPSLASLLRSFERLHAELWRRFVDAMRSRHYCIAPDERAEVIEQASAHLFAYFRAASEYTTVEYEAERTLLRHRAASHRAEIVAAFLAGSIDQHGAGRALGYRFNGLHVGYVAWSDGRSGRGRLDGVVASLVEHLQPNQHLCVPGDERSLYGWLTCHDGRWRSWAASRTLPTGIHLAWGAPHEGAAGFLATHLDALEARRVGEVLGTEGPVVFDDVAVASLASRDLVAACGFVTRQLGQLATGDDTANRLLETLRVYLDELASPTRTARRLHVHPNTVVKRLERIEVCLGREVDPASLSLRVAVELAPLVNTDTRRSQ